MVAVAIEYFGPAKTHTNGTAHEKVELAEPATLNALIQHVGRSYSPEFAQYIVSSCGVVLNEDYVETERTGTESFGRNIALQPGDVFARLDDFYLGGGATALRAECLNFLHSGVVALNDLAKDNVRAVQPWAWHGGDEKLRPVGVRTGVGHGEKTRLGVLFLEVLVREPLSIDGPASVSIMAGNVAALQHEVRNHSVENGVLVPKALLVGAQSSEVLDGLWNNLVVQVEHHTRLFLAVDGNVKVALD
ncbi:hypothetical protein KL933_002990 [Ogataea haglerorum]|uniref:Uncharacterized protein n=1 Tax=Ogataea haglerorum TaxID=1937702 RepID=A0AAN6D5C9_9ASCO|nr:uncharacterized protein KL911_001124 [Ogataea haglerorum]KAG7709496.1 hypothetical protein KL914_001886 [Ogataea haglerorum]KAG7717640.1 hypothetical protein KL913_002576 [Ogataea haglerorum]KAG7717942.1 hypothetical protein KL949_002914 [Ogataea haglerorum]KAG7727281.1 hypothetical protein KL933_002990 [Ogataea haglerorum]KAG7732828.1 hypothetical protein KL948_001331 [Ogataea haglerorum]